MSLVCEETQGRLDVGVAWPAIEALQNPLFYLSGPPPMLAASGSSCRRGARQLRASVSMPGISSQPLPARDLDHVLEHTPGLWDELGGARLFVTGGTGFFGRWMLESLLRANDDLRLGAEATVLTRDPLAFAAAAPMLQSIRR